LEEFDALLENPINWKKTWKKRYEVYIGMPRIGTEIYNVLEDARYYTDKGQMVVSGTAGEMWVTSLDKIQRTYVTCGGCKITEEFLRSKAINGVIPWIKVRAEGKSCHRCVHIPLKYRNIPIQTSYGTVLYINRDGIKHGMGDFVITGGFMNGRPDLMDIWAVNGEIFARTYDMRSFPEIYQKVKGGAQNFKTPYPKLDIQ